MTGDVAPVCLAYGLTVRSCVAIPGALPLDRDPSFRVDIVIGEGPVADGGVAEGPYRRVPGALVFEMPSVAQYRCDRSSVVIARCPGATDTDIAAYLVATALPAVLWMRGAIVLHAAAVCWPRAAGAVAIMGRSGIGKSTTVASLLGAGALLLADDTLRVEGTVAGGLAGGYFLGDGSRCFHGVTREHSLVSADLSAIVLLDLPRPAHAPMIERLSPVAGLAALLANRHRPRIPRLLGLEPALLAPLTTLAASVPVYRWQRRDGATALEPAELALFQQPA